MIADRLGAHPGTRLLVQLPGAAIMKLASLLAEIGPVLDRVANAEQAATECGTAPVTKAARKTSGVYFRWAVTHPSTQSDHRLRAQRATSIPVGRHALR